MLPYCVGEPLCPQPFKPYFRRTGGYARNRSADRDEGPLGDHLRRILVLPARDLALTDVVRGVLRGGSCPTAESFYRLRSAGVMAGESARNVRPRCHLYDAYLMRHLQ